MKLVTKLVLSFALALFIVVSASETFFAFKTADIVHDNIRLKTLVLVKTFESQFGASYKDEDGSGRHEAFSIALGSLAASFPEMFELNIYGRRLRQGRGFERGGQGGPSGGPGGHRGRQVR